MIVEKEDYGRMVIFEREYLNGYGFALAIPGDDFKYIASTKREYKFQSGEIIYFIPKKLFTQK